MSFFLGVHMQQSPGIHINEKIILTDIIFRKYTLLCLSEKFSLKFSGISLIFACKIYKYEYSKTN